MRRIGWIIATLLALTLLSTSVAFAAGTGSAQITAVAGLTGSPMAGVVIAIQGTGLNTQTGSNGVASFPSIPAGTFNFTASIPGANGGGELTINENQTNVMSVVLTSFGAPPLYPPMLALATTNVQAAGGALLTQFSTTSVVLVNQSGQTMSNVQLHINGPQASNILACYAGGAPGTTPCTRNPASNTAAWTVGTIPANGQSEQYIVEYNIGVAAAGVTGQPNIVWMAWGQSGTVASGQFTLNLGSGSNPSGPPAPVNPTGQGALQVIPVNAANGQGIAGAPVQLTSANGFSGAGTTDSTGQFTFPRLAANSYVVSVGGTLATVIVAPTGTTRIRIGGSGTGNAAVAGGVQITAFTITAGNNPIGQTTTVNVFNSGQNPISATVTITGPSATAFQSCNPAGCLRPQINNQSGIQYAGQAIGGLQTTSYAGTWVGGTASAGNLGPNSTTVTWGGRQAFIQLGN